MNEYIEGYHTEEEHIDYKKFCEFAKCFPTMFSTFRETEYGTPFDILSRTETGGTYAIELKSRYKAYGDCYIEFEKFTKMREIWRNQHFLPIYINFYPDCAYMWKLCEVKNVKLYLDVQIQPKKGAAYEGDRIGLDFAEAYKFEKRGNKYLLVSKPENQRNQIPPFYPDKLLDQEITKYNYYKLCQTANQE